MRGMLLGTGGYHPNERRHTACVMFPEIGVVFDAGSAFFRVPSRTQTDSLQVFLTHAHLDHICGLTYPLVAMLSKQIKHIKIYGEADKLAAIREHLFSELMFPVLPAFEFVQMGVGDTIQVPHGGTLTTCRLEHPGNSLGFRLDWPDRSLAYITDTVANGLYTEFVHDVDVLIHECYFPDAQAEWAVKTGHSHTTPVAQLAKDAHAKRLILVHVDPQQEVDDPIGLDVARRIFPATIIGEDLMEFDF
jgi:ribonuclease BN (tRNA processing enzyme)